MSDQQKIIDRIKKLMAYANDGAASAGEIENALGHAAKLIDAHHLHDVNFSVEEKSREEKMGRAWGKTQSSKFHRWETTLAAAVEELFGCIKHYLDGKQEPLIIDGAAQFYTGKFAGQRKMVSRIVFYGPDYEAQEAAELFTEWTKCIATMGIMRWGGAYRGDGEAYCQGFVNALYEKASQLNTNRRLTAAKPLNMLPNQASTAITLSERYTALQEKATEYLEKDLKIKLGSGSSRSGTRTGSSEAYGEGRAHGKAADFGRTRKSNAKQLPST